MPRQGDHRVRHLARWVATPVLVLSAALVLFALVQGAQALLAAAAITTLVSGVVAVAVYDVELLRARRAHGADRAAQARSYAAMYAAHVRVMAQGFTLANNRQQLEVPAKSAGDDLTGTVEAEPAAKSEATGNAGKAPTTTTARTSTPVRTQRRAAGSGNQVEWDTLAVARPSAEKVEPGKSEKAAEPVQQAEPAEKAEKPAAKAEKSKPADKAAEKAAPAEKVEAAGKVEAAEKVEKAAEDKPAAQAEKPAAKAEKPAAKAEQKDKPAAKTGESADTAKHAGDTRPVAPELWKGADAPTVVDLKAWEVRARIAEEERAAQQKAEGKVTETEQDATSDQPGTPAKAAEAEAREETPAQERRGA